MHWVAPYPTGMLSQGIRCLPCDSPAPRWGEGGRGSGNPQPTGGDLRAPPTCPSHAFSMAFTSSSYVRGTTGPHSPPPPAWSVWPRRDQGPGGALRLSVRGVPSWGQSPGGPSTPCPAPTSSKCGPYPEPGRLGFGQTQAWIQGALQGRDDGGRVDQGVAEAEVAQHGREGGQEHPLVLQGTGGSAGGGVGAERLGL